MSYIIYHNPHCSKSRGTLQLLQDKGIEPEIIEYLKNPPSADQIEKIIDLLAIPAMDLVRTGEGEFKTCGLNSGSIDVEDVIQAIQACPILLQRPIVIKDWQKAAIGRPPENILTLL